jgi:hypothetical protein
MKRIITERFALVAIGSILAFFSLLHILIITGLIPYHLVWGGRLKSSLEMLQFETVSLGATILMLVVVGIRAGIIRLRLPQLVLRILIGIMFLVFLLNTLGNLSSTSGLERWLFTPLTLLLAVCCLRLALTRNNILLAGALPTST